VKEVAEALYETLTQAGIDVLLDDRNQRPGVMFADAELLGIPHAVVVSDRGLDQDTMEYRPRGGEQDEIGVDKASDFLLERLAK
ncbi:MAG TPA: His/Gly/Thr/Pro-type tRNA ligase C-terminal domain-containing protein, partial [Wenzhouxiangella sp.]